MRACIPCTLCARACCAAEDTKRWKDAGPVVKVPGVSSYSIKRLGVSEADRLRKVGGQAGSACPSFHMRALSLLRACVPFPLGERMSSFSMHARALVWAI